VIFTLWAFPFSLEDDAPLFVDANGVEPIEVSGEGFEIVAGWVNEVLEFGREMDGGELDFSTGLDIAREPAGVFAFEDLGGGFVCEAFDHLGTIPDSVLFAIQEIPVWVFSA